MLNHFNGRPCAVWSGTDYGFRSTELKASQSWHALSSLNEDRAALQQPCRCRSAVSVPADPILALGQERDVRSLQR